MPRLFLFDRQQLANGSLPRNSPNGLAAPDTGGLHLDETAYGLNLLDYAGNTTTTLVTATSSTLSKLGL